MSGRIDWSQHRVRPVDVIFTPRPVYNGRAVLPWLLDATGTPLRVRALWVMDGDDPYPGEWALSGADPFNFDVMGRSWIASGDVTIPAPAAKEET